MATANFHRLQLIDACDALMKEGREKFGEGEGSSIKLLRQFAEAAIDPITLTDAEFRDLAKFWPKKEGLKITPAVPNNG